MNTSFVFLTPENRKELIPGFGSTSVQVKRTLTNLVNAPVTTLTTEENLIKGFSSEFTETYSEGRNVGAFISLNNTDRKGLPMFNRETGEAYTGLSIYMGPGRVAHNQNTVDPYVAAQLAVLHKDQVIRVCGPWRTNTTTRVRSIRITKVEALVVDSKGARSWVTVDASWPGPVVTESVLQPESYTVVDNVVPIAA
jgi:hypothetical protein